jgi:hypothetical protein
MSLAKSIRLISSLKKRRMVHIPVNFRILSCHICQNLLIPHFWLSITFVSIFSQTGGSSAAPAILMAHPLLIFLHYHLLLSVAPSLLFHISAVPVINFFEIYTWENSITSYTAPNLESYQMGTNRQTHNNKSPLSRVSQQVGNACLVTLDSQYRFLCYGAS